MGETAKEFTFTATIDGMSETATSKKKRTTKDVLHDIEELKKEREQCLMHEQNLDTAKKIYDLYESYIEVGFDEEQAWKLIITMIQTLKNN